MIKNRIHIFLSLIAIYIIFHRPIEDLIEIVFVNKILSKVYPSVLINVIFFGAGALFILVSIFKGLSYSRTIIVSVLFILIIYTSYRCFSDRWELVSLYGFTPIKYLDIIYLYAVGLVISFFKPEKELAKNTENSFFYDAPISSDGKDLLGFKKYIEVLATKIKDTHYKEAFAIGINGKWGSGKTSFINMLKAHFEKEDVIAIDFNPWDSSTPIGIIQDFFDRVEEELHPYRPSLARLLHKYSKKLIELNDSEVTQAINAIIGSESLSGLKDKIETDLKAINKKLLIYIDDLDRLDKKEIIEVIRLIRNTANFYNTFFIVGYDRSYVLKALQDFNSHNHERFLEKIFQVEITLPLYDKSILRAELKEKLTTIYPDFDIDFGGDFIGSVLGKPYYLDVWLENLRDVTRLANSLAINFKQLKGEVVFHDFLRFEMLRLKYPSIYELLFNMTAKFLVRQNKSLQPSNLYTLNKKEFEDYLTNNIEPLAIDKTAIDKIVDLVDGIFQDGYFTPTTGSYLSVRYPSKFRRYFAYGLLDSELSEIDFSKSRELDIDGFKYKLKEWVDKGLTPQVHSRLKEIKDFDNKDDFEKIITGIFYLANLKEKSVSNQFHRSGIVWYDIGDLIDKMVNYDGEIGKKHYANIKEYNEFVESFFKDAVSPYLFESSLANLLYWRDLKSEYFPIAKPELETFITGYLEKYCNESDKIDANIWELYRNCTLIEWEPTGNNSQVSKTRKANNADDIFKNFILNKDLDGFLATIITGDFDPNRFYISEIVLSLFCNYNNFKQVLNEQDDGKWEYLKEFKEFFAELEKHNFSRRVAFEFKTIDLTRK